MIWKITEKLASAAMNVGLIGILACPLVYAGMLMSEIVPRRYISRSDQSK